MNTVYEQAIELLTSREKFHICLGLDRVSKILELLGNPQENLKIIHVAGTNGKGSTCAILERILYCAGYKTGLYTSPHIVEYTERIKINGTEIPKIDFYDYIFEINNLSKSYDIYLTEFELLTCCAYKYFSDKEVDICIVETGLGGRLDATNVISKNVLSVITSISLDHVDRLGNTVEKIAYEKAGIIKSDCPVLISNENNGYSVVESCAKDKNSKVISILKNIEMIFEDGENFVVYNSNKYAFSMLGLWQKENLALVFGVVDYLRSLGYELTENALKKALRTVNWPCRMQYIPKYNLLIDGTHNPDGARVLRQSLDYYFPDKKRVWIYGSISTKDYKKVMEILFNKEDEVYFYDFDYSSAVSFLDLSEYQKDACQINLKEIEYLIEENKSALIVVCGSFYMIGQMLKKGVNFSKYCHGG